MLAASLALAGCAAAPGAAAADPAPPVSGDAPRGEACTGWVLAASWPGNHPRAHVPAGWESQQGPMTIRLQAWECQRIAWGPFERGPVRLVLETHDQQVAPAGCRASDQLTTLDVLQSLWIDDPGLAAHLAADGLPAQWSAIDAASDPFPGEASVLRWRWGASGAPSQVDVPAWSPAIAGPAATARLFWDNGTSLAYLDLVTTVAAPGLEAGPAVVTGRSLAMGAFATPMLLADVPGPVVAPANAFSGGAWSGTIHRFEDLRCASPA